MKQSYNKPYIRKSHKFRHPLRTHSNEHPNRCTSIDGYIQNVHNNIESIIEQEREEYMRYIYNLWYIRYEGNYVY